jgi:flagellar basal-body rod protein FlgB
MATNFDDVPLLALLKQRMSWLGARQNVLAQNVANADTPGFTARDLKPINFADVLKRSTSTPASVQSGMMVTDPRHIGLAQSATPAFTDMRAPDGEATPSGNTVSLEQEMIKVAGTQAEYQAASNLYAKAIDMMKIAIGR